MKKIIKYLNDEVELYNQYYEYWIDMKKEVLHCSTSQAASLVDSDIDNILELRTLIEMQQIMLPPIPLFLKS